MNESPPFLTQQNPRLSIKESEKIVDKILKQLGVKLKEKGKQKEFIIKNQGTDKEQKKRYFELVQQTRETGVCGFIQGDLDVRDVVFGGTLGFSTPNWQLDITTEWAGYSKKLQGPCKVTPSELEISDDIEFYKEECCIESSNYDFILCFRNYRGYLFSSIALIDCYINRHIVLSSFNGHTSENFERLKLSRNTEERIELFIKEYCSFSFEEFKKERAWDDFKKLKNLRNEVTHAFNPYLGVGIKEVANNLNLSINGIGTFLKYLQEGQGRLSLGFIERVRTSPVVHFNKITLRGEGEHKVEKQLNKISR